MKQEQALLILIEAVKLATKRGAYELSEAKMISDAVDSFVKKEEKVEDKTGELKDEPKQEDVSEDVQTGS